MAQPSRASHYNRRLVGDEIKEFDLSYQLSRHLREGNARQVDKMLADGASIEGSTLVEYRPLMEAAAFGMTRMIKLLLSRGADINAGAIRDVIGVRGELVTAAETRPAHLAITGKRLDALHLLLREGADPNAVDSAGSSLLQVAISIMDDARMRVAMATALLEANTDVTLTDKMGRVPLHVAAAVGSTEVVGMLLARAPETLNHVDRNGCTPLMAAADCGQDTTVSQLLAAGARQPQQQERPTGKPTCPLKYAVYRGHERVVAVLLDRGLPALGGSPLALPPAIVSAVLNMHPRILHMLLSAEGEDRRVFWVNHAHSGVCPHLVQAAAQSSLAVVGVLMASGADENAHRVRDCVGIWSKIGKRLDRDRADAAICRMLERGPAFRARSWAYPSLLDAAAAAAAVGACRDGGGANARDVLPAIAARTLPIRIYRPKKNGAVFARLLGRQFVRRSPYETLALSTGQ